MLYHTDLGKQILIDIALIRLEAGNIHPILEVTHHDLGYLQDGWVVGICRFLETVDAKVKFSDIQSPQCTGSMMYTSWMPSEPKTSR
jgi:hypothetical protein